MDKVSECKYLNAILVRPESAYCEPNEMRSTHTLLNLSFQSEAD